MTKHSYDEITMIKSTNLSNSLITEFIVAFILSLSLSVGPLFAKDKNDFAYRFLPADKETKNLSSLGSDHTKDGWVILGGDIKLPHTHLYEGVRWLACVSPEGKVLWSARAEEQPEAASLFLLKTDGDSIWQVGVLKDGLFRAAKFEATSLRKVASVQMTFEPITTPAAYVGFQSGADTDPDLQISMVQPVGNSIRFALFSSDLRLIFDKLYAMPVSPNEDAAKILASSFAIRLPDQTGYYLFSSTPDWRRLEKTTGRWNHSYREQWDCEMGEQLFLWLRQV